MRGIVLALLGLAYIDGAKKNFRTGDVPVGFDNFSLEENSNSHEGFVGAKAAQRIRGVVASEEPSQEALQKDKEAVELARTIEWEQRKIQELKEERERIRRQKKEEIEKIMKEQAVEQARIEAARAQRKRMRVIEEQRRKLMEAKRERERQEQLLVELELRKQEEIRRLEEEKKKQKKKLEEEKRRLFEEEQQRKKMEEEQRKREEEERRRWLEEEQKRVEREQQEERMRIEREQKEARIRREEEESKRQEEEENRMLKEAEEMEQSRQAEEEDKRKMQAVEEGKRRMQEEEERKKEMEEQEKRRIRRVEEEEKRRLEEAERERELQRKRLQAQRKTNVEHIEEDFEKQHDNLYKISSTKSSAKLENKISKRHRHLMARFGTQALAGHSENGSHENQETTVVQEEVGRERIPHNNSNNFDEENDEIQNSNDGNQYRPPIEFDVDQPVERRRKSKKRKNRRKLHGIKSLSTLKSKEMKNHPFEKDQTAASFLGGWTETTDANGEAYVKVLPTTTPDPSLSRLAVIVQPISRTESPELPAAADMMANIPPIPNNFNEEEYLRQYYEQYYKEWYRQHNEANTASLSQTSLPRRQIKIQFGKPTHLVENVAPQPTLGTAQQASTFGTFNSAPQVAVGQSHIVDTAAPPNLSRDQLDKICADIQKTTQSFGIKDPKTFALNNCPLIKMYYKQVTCEQINHVMDYCEQGSFLA